MSKCHFITLDDLKQNYPSINRNIVAKHFAQSVAFVFLFFIKYLIVSCFLCWWRQQNPGSAVLSGRSERYNGWLNIKAINLMYCQLLTSILLTWLKWCLNISGQRRDVNQHPLCETTGLWPFCCYCDQSQPNSGPASKKTRHWTVHAPQQTRDSTPDLWHVSMNELYYYFIRGQAPKLL